jgi:hypothetical protein
VTVYTSMSEYDNTGPRIIDLDGFPHTLASAEAELERLQDKVDEYERQLDMSHDRATKRRLRARMEATEARLDHLHAALHPCYSNTEGYIGGSFDAGELIACRATACSNLIHRSIKFQTGGWCPVCFAIATNPERK